MTAFCQGITSPYKIVNHADSGNITLSIDDENLWLLHASGAAQSIKLSPFAGSIQLEESNVIEENNDYLVWKQVENMMVAVNRFNVASFWNTFTGKLVHKKVLEEHEQINDAYKYRCHGYQARYQDPANQFDAFTQTLVSLKPEQKGASAEDDLYSVKIVKLHVHGDGYVSC